MSKVALVLGGTGNIGSACVKVFLEDSNYKKVVIASRSKEKIDKTREAMKASLNPDAADKVIAVVGNIGEEKSAAEMKQKVVAAVGEKIDTVISSLGFSYRNNGPMISVSDEQMKDVFGTQFYPAFVGYKTFMPMVQNNKDGSYIFVTGGGPDMYLGPGTGVITIGGSASTALAKVVMKEHARDAVCCTEVSFQAGVCPDPTVMGNTYVWLKTSRAAVSLVSIASKRKADGKTLKIQTDADMQRLIDNGTKDETNGVAF